MNDLPDDLVEARGAFKVRDDVETARVSEAWVDDAPGPTVDVVDVYVKDDADDEAIFNVAANHDLTEHKNGHDPAQNKLAFRRTDN